MAEAFASKGWHTVGMSAMRVAGPKQNMDRGFAAYEVHHDARASDLTAKALERLDAGPSGATFLWIHYADPHFPYEPHADQPNVPDAPVCRTLIADAKNKKIRRPLIYTNHEGRAQAALVDCLKLYDAEVTAVDTAIGELLDGWIARKGNSSWIVVSADHGENQGEQGLFYEHGPNVHDASLRIPLIVAGPEVTPGRDDGPARLEDVHPTLLELAGLAATRSVDGISLVSRLAGEEGGPQVAVAESGSALHPLLTDYVTSGRRAFNCVNDARWSLCDRRGRTVLYDHEADPGLRTDVARANPDVVARLSDAGKLWPPESGRERTARTPAFKLVQRPNIAGGYTSSLYALPDDTTDVSASHPEVVAELEKALLAWGAPTPAQGDRSEADLEALRSLGYVE